MNTSNDIHALQLLAFTLDDDRFAVELQHVVEVQRWSCVSPLPQSPPSVLGAMNLRGAIVPVVGLREHLGKPRQTPTRWNVIVVLKAQVGERTATVGLLVDDVAEAFEATAKDILDSDSTARNNAYVSWVLAKDDGLQWVLDVERLVKDAAELEDAAA